MIMLELRGIRKRFSPQILIGPLELQLLASRTYALIGPSGCGKSTVMKLMLGLVRPDTGSVHIAGEELTATNAKRQRQRIGYVIQQGGLFPHLTVEENVALLARHLGWQEQRVRERLQELAELTHLPAETMSRYPAELSGGQRQRVSLMRALMLDPDVLMLDEPLGALDPMIRSELQTDLRQIFRDLGKTVVLVTHDLHEAAYFANQVILLKSGQIVQRGNLREFYDAPADPFVTRFVKAQRNELPEVGP